VLNVGELMTRNPEHIVTTGSVQEAINKLFELDVRHLPVVDEQGELVGVLSDRDLREYSQPYEMQFENLTSTSEREATPVSDIMQGDVISAHPEDDVTDIIDMMIDQKIGAVPIVDPLDGNLVGIVSYIDILRAAADLW
jgi:acetoin utilization protein AcuB